MQENKNIPKKNRDCGSETVNKPIPKKSKTFQPKYKRVPWTEESSITANYLKKHIMLNKAPKKNECEVFKKH